MENKKSNLTKFNKVLSRTSIEKQYKELLRQAALFADYQERIAELQLEKVYAYARMLADKKLISVEDYKHILSTKK